MLHSVSCIHPTSDLMLPSIFRQVHGGALVIANSSNAVVLESSFDSNRANGSASSIIVYPGGYANVLSSEFESNYVSHDDDSDIFNLWGAGFVSCTLSVSKEDGSQCSPVQCENCFCASCELDINGSADIDKNDTIETNDADVDTTKHGFLSVTRSEWALLITSSAIFILACFLALGSLRAFRLRSSRDPLLVEMASDTRNLRLVTQLLDDVDRTSQYSAPGDFDSMPEKRGPETSSTSGTASLCTRDEGPTSLPIVPESSTLASSMAPVFVVDSGLRIVLWSLGMSDVTLLTEAPPVLTALPFVSDAARSLMCNPISKMFLDQCAADSAAEARGRFEMHIQTPHGSLLLLMTATTMSTPGLICISGREADCSLLALRGRSGQGEHADDDSVSALTESDATSDLRWMDPLARESCVLHIYDESLVAASKIVQRAWRTWHEWRHQAFAMVRRPAFIPSASLREQMRQTILREHTTGRR